MSLEGEKKKENPPAVHSPARRPGNNDHASPPSTPSGEGARIENYVPASQAGTQPRPRKRGTGDRATPPLQLIFFLFPQRAWERPRRLASKPLSLSLSLETERQSARGNNHALPRPREAVRAAVQWRKPACARHAKDDALPPLSVLESCSAPPVVRPAGAL